MRGTCELEPCKVWKKGVCVAGKEPKTGKKKK